MYRYAPTFIVFAALALAACTENSQPAQDAFTPSDADAGADPESMQTTPGRPPGSAAAELAPTEGNDVTGTLAVADAPEGVRIMGAVQGLAPNAEFGFHIHEKGDCSTPDASSAGGHFNPEGKPHGHPEKGEHHAGDMVNIRSDSAGVAEVDTTVKGVKLHAGQPTDILAKAIVVHAKPDDYKSQPSGASGDRLACGVINYQKSG